MEMTLIYGIAEQVPEWYSESYKQSLFYCAFVCIYIVGSAILQLWADMNTVFYFIFEIYSRIQDLDRSHLVKHKFLIQKIFSTWEFYTVH